MVKKKKHVIFELKWFVIFFEGCKRNAQNNDNKRNETNKEKKHSEVTEDWNLWFVWHKIHLFHSGLSQQLYNRTTIDDASIKCFSVEKATKWGYTYAKRRSF